MHGAHARPRRPLDDGNDVAHNNDCNYDSVFRNNCNDDDIINLVGSSNDSDAIERE